MAGNRYNGWANYATWRINLEIIDDITSQESDSIYLADKETIKEYVDEIVENNPELMMSYARAFLNEVDWYEISSAVEENQMLTTPWDEHIGTFDDLVGEADENWSEEDVQFLLDQNEEYLDKLSPDSIQELEDLIEKINNQ